MRIDPASPPTGVAGSLPRQALFGLDFVAATSVDEVVAELMAPASWTGDGRLSVVATPNVDQLIHLDRSTYPVACRIVAGARYVLPDGQPIVWASRMLGEPLPARLAGSDLVNRLFPRVVAAQRSTLVVASSERVAVHTRSEGGHVDAVVAPSFARAEASVLERFLDDCAARIEEREVSFVFVGVGFPAMYHVIDGIVSRLRPAQDGGPLFLAVGASFEMYYGMVRRAPLWMQESGFEWFFRFLQEPRRMFHRYFVDDTAFAGLFLAERRSRQLPRGQASA
jgi:N-acetylglucosaminyldiphosphoundecaprenol N-acetyl-beta-D-mannosaminyltransferase